MDRMSVCREWRESIGAYLLGALPDDQRAGLVAHMDGCPACRGEVAELETVADALEAVDPERTITNEPPPHLYSTVFSRIESESLHRRRSRKRLRVRSAVAVAAALIVAATIALRPSGEAVRFSSTPGGVVASAVLAETDAGVEIHLEADGLEAGTYALWMEGYDGVRLSAGTFEVTASGRVEGDFLAGWRRDQCHIIGVTLLGGDDTFSTELPHVSG